MEYSLALENLLPALDSIYDSWESAAFALHLQLAQEKPQVKITCKKGCGACCHFPIIPATAGEAFVLLSRLLAAGHKLEDLHSQFLEYAKAYFKFARDAGTLPFTHDQQTKFIELNLPCPLFIREENPKNSTGHCSVFGARPIICDSYNSIDNPGLCLSKSPHLSFESLIQRGESATEEIRQWERHFFGRSALGHLPLLLASLCTQKGMQTFLNPPIGTRNPSKSDEDQAELDFEFYMDLLACAGYQMQAEDIHSLIEAQEELRRRSEPQN